MLTHVVLSIFSGLHQAEMRLTSPQKRSINKHTTPNAEPQSLYFETVPYYPLADEARSASVLPFAFAVLPLAFAVFALSLVGSNVDLTPR